MVLEITQIAIQYNKVRIINALTSIHNLLVKFMIRNLIITNLLDSDELTDVLQVVTFLKPIAHVNLRQHLFKSIMPHHFSEFIRIMNLSVSVTCIYILSK